MVELMWMENPESNIGVWPGPGNVLIDIDRKKLDAQGELIDGMASLCEFMNMDEHALLSSTYVVKTPTGGYHLYYSCPEDSKFANRAGMLPGVDVRGADGYVVGPGSVIRGNMYESYNRVDIAPIPENLADSIGKARERDDLAQDSIYQWDNPTAVARATHILKHRAPAIEGRGGNDHTYVTAQKVRDVAVSPEKCFELLMLPGGWNSRCEPPWEGAELMDIIDNAYRYGKDRPGSKGGSLFDLVGESEDVPAEYFNDVLGLGIEGGDSNDKWAQFRRSIWFGDAFRNQERNYEFVAHGWIPARGFTCFLAQKSHGKTTMINDLIFCMINDMDWHGIKVDKGWSVCYIAAEDGEGVIARQNAWCKEHGIESIPNDRLMVFETNGPQGRAGFDITNDDSVVMLEEFIRTETKFQKKKILFVVDTWQRLTAEAESQSDDSSMQRAVQNLEWLCNRFEGPAILAAHPPKGSTGTVMGSSIIDNSSNAIITIEKLKGGIHILEVTRIKGAREDSKMTVSFEVIELGGVNAVGEKLTSVVPFSKGGAGGESAGTVYLQQAVVADIVKEMLKESAMLWKDKRNQQQPSLMAVAKKMASLPDILPENENYPGWRDRLEAAGIVISGEEATKSKPERLDEYTRLTLLLGLDKGDFVGRYVSDGGYEITSFHDMKTGKHGTARLKWRKLDPSEMRTSKPELAVVAENDIVPETDPEKQPELKVVPKEDISVEETERTDL
jgi:hypothetical protein